MLHAKMWQWRFINKYKKLLDKTAQMLRMEWKRWLQFSDRNRQEIHVLLWQKHNFPNTRSNLDVEISHFSSDNNCCLAVAKPTFFCETLFSGARFPVRRVVLVKNPICIIIIIIIIIVYYYHYYHYFFVTCCDPCLCWEIDMPSIAFCRRLRQVPPPPDGMPGMPCVGGMRGGQGWPWDHGMRDNLHGTHMKKWELIGFTSSYGSFNGEHDGEQ